MTEWTIETLREHFASILLLRDQRVAAVGIALEKRLDGLNELRKEVVDDRQLYARKDEMQIILIGVNKEVEALQLDLKALDRAKNYMWGFGAGVVLMSTILSGAVAFIISKFFK